MLYPTVDAPMLVVSYNTNLYMLSKNVKSYKVAYGITI